MIKKKAASRTRLPKGTVFMMAVKPAGEDPEGNTKDDART